MDKPGMIRWELNVWKVGQVADSRWRGKEGRKGKGPAVEDRESAPCSWACGCTLPPSVAGSLCEDRALSPNFYRPQLHPSAADLAYGWAQEGRNPPEPLLVSMSRHDLPRRKHAGLQPTQLGSPTGPFPCQPWGYLSRTPAHPTPQSLQRPGSQWPLSMRYLWGTHRGRVGIGL